MIIALFLGGILVLVTLHARSRLNETALFPYLFAGFLFLYNAFPFLASQFQVMTLSSGFQLVGDIALVEQQILISTISLYVFLAAYTIRPSRFDLRFDQPRTIYFSPLFFFLLIFPLGLYLSSQNNWTTGSREGDEASLTAYVRNLLGVLAIFSFVKYRQERWKCIFVLFLFALLSFVDTQRTNLFVVGIAFAITRPKAKNTVAIFGLAIVAVLAIGIVRNGVNIFNVLYPLFGEGVFGSYGVLQALSVLTLNEWDPGNLLLPLNGIFNWLGGLLRANLDLPMLGSRVAEGGYVYYPMGGFFFLSDAQLFLPYLGPAIYTLFIVFYVTKVSRGRQDDVLKAILYANAFLLIKSEVSVFFKFLLFQLLVYVLFSALNRFFQSFSYQRVYGTR